MFADSVRKKCCLIAVVVLLCGRAFGEETSPRISVQADGKGGYTFDTGVLRGTLCPNGKLQGLTSVTHIPTGTRLDGSLGILSYYRVFTTGKRYGTGAWDWPSAARQLSDAAVHVAAPATAERPFDFAATYRWRNPQTVDVETTVTARADLSGFESFLASYFDAAFPSPYVWARNQGGEPGSSLLLGKKDYGDWLMFIKDGDARTRLIQDGRWLLEPHPVSWTIVPRLSAPLCLRRGDKSDLAVILMAPPEDCFAVAMPYDGEPHYSLYLSLFGRDLKAGDSAKARTRFTVAPTPSNEQLLALYDQYMEHLRSPKPFPPPAPAEHR